MEVSVKMVIDSERFFKWVCTTLCFRYSPLQQLSANLIQALRLPFSHFTTWHESRYELTSYLRMSMYF